MTTTTEEPTVAEWLTACQALRGDRHLITYPKPPRELWPGWAVSASASPDADEAVDADFEGHGYQFGAAFAQLGSGFGFNLDTRERDRESEVGVFVDIRSDRFMQPTMYFPASAIDDLIAALQAVRDDLKNAAQRTA